MEKTSANFVITDLYLASAISLLCNLEPLLKAKGGGIVTFTFPQSEEVIKVAEAFVKDILDIRAFSYANRQKTLRTELLVTRDEALNRILNRDDPFSRGSREKAQFANSPCMTKEAGNEEKN